MKILNYKADSDIYRHIAPNGCISFKANDFWKRKLTKEVSFLGLFRYNKKRKYDAILVENKSTTQTKMLELKTFVFIYGYVYIYFGEYL
jgi:hypothetical protein